MIVSGLRPLAANLVDQPIRLALLPEHRTGGVGRPGLSGSRAGRAWSPEFTVTQVRLDGQSIEATAEPASLVNAGAGILVVEATDQVAQLRLGLTIELSPVGLLRCRAEPTNLADQAYGLNDCVIAYPVPSSAAEIMDFAGHWGKERVPQRLPLTTGVHLREGRKGRTGPDAATLLHVGTPGFGFADGEIWAVHVGWSGNHTHYAERLFTGEQVIGGGELLLPGEVVLQTGESYRTPWVYGAYGVGLDAVARRFHRWLRSRATHPGTDRPVTLNVWEAVYFDHDQARLLDLAERAAKLGVERYVLDDGWFGGRRDDLAGLGDWTVSPDVWPDGLHPLVDKVVGLGMQFGLWFEPEMINLDSDTARAHPEWIMTTGNRWPVPSRSQQVINLGNPDCYTIVGAPIMVTLIAAVAGHAGARDRVFGVIAVAWMLALAVLTIPVHFVDLTVTSAVDRASPTLRYVLGFEWPSVTYAVEIVAWQIFLPLSLFFAALVFHGHGKARVVRIGFFTIAVLCLAGLAGPITGDMNLRLIAVVGYGVAFPAACVVLALLLRNWTVDPTRRTKVSS